MSQGLNNTLYKSEIKRDTTQASEMAIIHNNSSSFGGLPQQQLKQQLFNFGTAQS